MDAKLKATWVKALRSGEYEQAECVLRSSTDGFCCLGVALDIQEAKWVGRGAVLNGWSVDMLGTPPSEMLGGVSLEEANVLIAMNDGQGQRKLTFPEIADYIEQNL